MHELDEQHAKLLGHEPEGIDVRWIWLFAAVLVATVIFALVLMWGLLQGIVAIGGNANEAPQQQVPMAAGVPELDANQVVELRRLRQLEDDLLDSYGWVDAQTGIARIPIERAMAIVAEKGLTVISSAEAGTTVEAATTTEATTGLPSADQSEPASPATEPAPSDTQSNE